jgi:hypothetical protein
MDRGWDTGSFTLSGTFVKKPNNSELEDSVALMGIEPAPARVRPARCLNWHAPLPCCRTGWVLPVRLTDRTLNP